MSMSIGNSSLMCPLRSSGLLDSLQCGPRWNDTYVKVLPGSRLAQDSNGCVSLIAKKPFEVVGERFMGPLVDRITNMTSTFFSYFQSSPPGPSSDPVEMRPRSEAPLSQEERLYSCLQRDPGTADLYNFNRDFSVDFAGKKLEDPDYSSVFQSLITRLQKEHYLPPYLWIHLQETYKETLEKCLRSIQNSGSVSIIGKTPFKVVGERVMGPLVNTITILTSTVISTIAQLGSQLNILTQSCRPGDPDTDPFKRFRTIYLCLNQDASAHRCEDCDIVLSEHFANKDCKGVDLNAEIKSVFSTLKTVLYYHDDRFWSDMAKSYQARLVECLSRT